MSVGYDDNLAGGINIAGGATSTIGFGSKASPRMKLSSTATDSFLQIGSPTFANPAQSGILIGSDGGTAEFHIYNAANKKISFDGSDFDIRTTKLYLETTGLKLSGDSGTGTSNYLALGSATSATAGSGIWLDGGGNARFGTATNSDNFIYFNGSTLQIKADDIDISSTAFNLNANGGDLIISSSDHRISLANENIILDGTSTGFMSIGTVTGVTDTGGSNKGFYAEGDGDFITKAAANKYIQFNGGDLDIKTGIFKLDTAKLDIDSSAGGSGSIALGATPPTQYNSGTGFFVDGAGKFLLGNSGGNKVQFDGSTLTVAGTINIISGDLAGVTSNTISGSYPPASASQDLGFATQVVLDSDGMSLKNADASKTLATYGKTAKIFDGLNSNTYVEVGGKGITQVSGSVTGSLLTNGVMSLFGAGAEKAVFSSTGSLFRGDAQNTFTRVDSNGLTIVDNGSVQGTFTNGTINLYGNNGTDRKVTIDSDGFKAYYDSNNYINVNSSTMDIYAGSSTAAASFGTTVTLRGNNSDADKITINSGGIKITEGSATIATFGSNIHLNDGQIYVGVTGSSGDWLEIDSSGIDIMRNNVSVGQWQDSALRLGKVSNEHVTINDAGMKVMDGTTLKAHFGSDIHLNDGQIYVGVTGSDWLEIDSTSIDINRNNVSVGQFTDSAMRIGRLSNEHVIVNDSGMKVMDGTTLKAHFGSDIHLNDGQIYVGVTGSDWLEIDSTSIDIFRNNTSVINLTDSDFRIGAVAKDHTIINNSGLKVMDGTAMRATFGADAHINGGTIYVGVTGSSGDWVEIDSSGIDIMRNNVSTAKFEDSTITLAPNTGAPTDDAVVISSTNGVKIYDNSTDYVHLASDGMSVYAGHASNKSAHFGSTISLYSDGALGSHNRTLHITDHGINIGQNTTGPSGANTPSAIINNVSITGAGVRVYGDATNTYADVGSSGLDIVKTGTNVANFGATVRVGEDDNAKSAFRVDGSGNVTVGTGNTTNFQVFADGTVSSSNAIFAKGKITDATAVEGLIQGFVNMKYTSSNASAVAHTAYDWYSSLVKDSAAGAYTQYDNQYLIDIGGGFSSTHSTRAIAVNFMRFDSSFWNDKAIGHIRFPRTGTDAHFGSAQVFFEGGSGGAPYINDASDFGGNKYVYNSSTPAWEQVWLDNFHIHVDTEDFAKPFYQSNTIGGNSYGNSWRITSGMRVMFVANTLDWKVMPNIQKFEGIRPKFYSGLNVGNTNTAHATYELYVAGDIGATGNVTAYADYVCDDCGWHHAAKPLDNICPSCGGTNVNYHDDVALLKQIIDTTAAHPTDMEKQYQAYEKLAKLGVIDINIDNQDDRLGLREKDIQVTHNLHALNNYLISGLVQERKRTEGLEDRIEKMETIIKTFGGEPGKGVAHNFKDGKIQPFNGDYSKDDGRVIKMIRNKGVKVYHNFNKMKERYWKWGQKDDIMKEDYKQNKDGSVNTKKQPKPKITEL